MEKHFVYILTLLFTVAFSSFVSYDEQRARASRTALGVVLLAALVSLFLNTVGDLENIAYTDIPEHGESADESFVEQNVSEAFVKGVESAIVQKFSFSEAEVAVTCGGFDFETVSAEKISVSLSGRAAFADVRSVREYVENLRLGECEVTVSFE